MLVLEKLNYQKSFFIHIELDRNSSCPVIRFSKRGGNNYKKLLTKYPHEILSIFVDYKKNLMMNQLMDVAKFLGIESQKSQLTFIIKHLYDLFIERDV